MSKITFIWHDCFVVETNAANFVFDYWLDADGKAADFPSFLQSLSPAKPLYVFVSHGHKDHFNPAIFGWAGRFREIHYFVSKDVAKRIRHITSETSVYTGPKVAPSSVTEMRPGNVYADGIVTALAFPSTDIGNSYMVEVGSLRFFHAGDLNAWIWLDESTPEEVNKAKGDYLACLREISSYLLEKGGDAKIDYCFFPVDSRIGRDYFTGAKIFVEKFNVCRFFPMHFDLGDDEERNRRRKDAIEFNFYANPQRGEYIPLVLNGSGYLSAD